MKAIRKVPARSSRATTIREVAQLISDALDITIELIAQGEFRPGEMRHLTSDITRISSIGFKPQTDLATGIGRYMDWIRAQVDVRDYFALAEPILRAKGIVHQVAAKASNTNLD